MNPAEVKNREADDYAAALRQIVEATKPPLHSKGQRRAYQIARDILAAWGRSAR